MTDKNGNEIFASHKCIVDGKHLGMVTGFSGNNVTVLMLADAGRVCNEVLLDPSQIEMKD